MILQLNPPIPLETDKGPGIAHFLVDPGIESDAQWVVFLASGEIWWVPNTKVRACKNYTAERLYGPSS